MCAPVIADAELRLSPELRAHIASEILSLGVCVEDGFDDIRLEMLHICAAAVLGVSVANPMRRSFSPDAPVCLALGQRADAPSLPPAAVAPVSKPVSAGLWWWRCIEVPGLHAWRPVSVIGEDGRSIACPTLGFGDAVGWEGEWVGPIGEVAL